MIRCCTSLILGLMVALPTAVNAADANPTIVDVTISDGARLVQHFHDGIYFKLWSSPSLTSVRAKLDEVKPQAQEQLGFDPFAALAGLVSARLQVSFPPPTPGAAPSESEPEVLFQVDLGAQATVLFHGLIDKLPLPAATVAGADETILLPDGGMALARYGTVLVVGKKEKLHKPGAVPASTHDLSVHVDGAALGAAVRAHAEEPDAKTVDKLLVIIKPLLVPIHADFDLVADGMASSGSVETTLSWVIPVERSFLGRLPATAYSCGGIGLDGGALWTTLVKPLLGALSEKDGNPADQAETQFNAFASAAGLELKLADLMAGLKGTFFTATTPGAPIPGITLGIPRSPAIDQLITFALKQLMNDPPAEGMSTSVVLPNVPVPINLVRSAAAWIITSDAALAGSWSGDPTNAWAVTPLGKLATTSVDAETVSFAVSDTPTELRSMQGYLAMGLAAAPLEPPVKQAIINGLSQIIAQAGLSSEVSKQGKQRITSAGHGLLGVGSMTGIAMAAGIAAVVIPNIVARKTVAATNGPAARDQVHSDAQAATALKSQVFVAEVQFQAANYRDRDKDGIGDFGFFGEMAGAPVAGKPDGLTLSLLTPAWNAVSPVIGSYQFSVYIPDGKGGAMSAADDHDITAGQPKESPESGFVAYAWPVKPGPGSQVLAITVGGMVYASPFKLGDPPPAWNAVFGGKGWHDPVAWPQFKKGNAAAQGKVLPPPTAKPKPAGAGDF